MFKVNAIDTRQIILCNVYLLYSDVIFIEQAMAKMACQFHNSIVKKLSTPIHSSSTSSIHKGAPKKNVES
jgi:hypothetical protein